LSFDFADNDERLRQKLALFFMDPVKKFIAKRQVR
jgi:hypothetical protein